MYYYNLHAEYQKNGRLAQLVFDSGSGAIFTKTPDGIVTSWSKGAENFYGYTKEEIVGKSVSMIMPDNKKGELQEILGKINKGEPVLGRETQRVKKDGTVVDVNISVIPLYDNGKIIGAVIFPTDISHLKNIERKFYLLFENAPDGIFIADLGGHYVDINNSACAMLGYSKDELIKKTIVDLVPPEDMKRLEETRKTLSEPGKTHIAEWTLKKKDGTFLPVESHSIILADGRWIAFVRDISAQKRAEKKFAFIFESAPDAQIMVDAQGTIMLVNQMSEKMFGYMRNELVGQKIEILVPEKFKGSHPLKREKFIAEARSKGMDTDMNLTARKKDGTELAVDIKLSPMELEGDILVLAAIRDISEIKRLASYARNLIEASPDAFIVSDLKGVITDANKAAMHTLCSDSGKIIGILLEKYFTPPEFFRENIEKVLEFGHIKDVPLKATNGRGKGLDFLVSASVYNDESGKKVGIFYVLKDISELIAAATRLIAHESIEAAK